jgi:20S proteasome alpha/beta subunit
MASEDDGRKEVAGDGAKPNEDDESNETTFRSALLVNEPERSIPSTMSILTPHLLVATGGTPTDAVVLLDRIRSVASDMHNSNFGGTGFTYQSAPRKGRRSRSGMFGVDGCNLARNVADMIQIPTQSIGTRAGSMLAASALIVDAASEGCNIWRIDPTGQFWSCDAAAVGRGAGVAESFLLKEITQRMKSPANVEDTEEDDEEEEENDDDGIDDGMASLTNQDVKKFLLSLSVDEAIALAQKCVLKVYEEEEEELKLPAHDNDEQDPSDAADKKEEDDKPGGSDFDSRARSIISMGGAVLRPSAPTAKILDL